MIDHGVRPHGIGHEARNCEFADFPELGYHRFMSATGDPTRSPDDDRKQVQLVVGYIGVVDDLYARLGTMIRLRGYSWTGLARVMSMTRQNLIQGIGPSRPSISFDLVQQICEAIDADPYDLIEPIDPPHAKELR